MPRRKKEWKKIDASEVEADLETSSNTRVFASQIRSLPDKDLFTISDSKAIISNMNIYIYIYIREQEY